MSTAAEYVVIGHFDFLDDTTAAIESLQAEGKGDDVLVYSPLPEHGLEDLLYKNRKRSPVRRFTLLGGLTGCLGGYLMTSWMSVDYPLRTSAKPILSYPAYTVIAFECTILLGCLFTLVGLLHNCRIPNICKQPAFRPKFTEGTFGVTVRTSDAKKDSIKQLLEGHGAREVEVQYVR